MIRTYPIMATALSVSFTSGCNPKDNTPLDPNEEWQGLFRAITQVRADTEIDLPQLQGDDYYGRTLRVDPSGTWELSYYYCSEIGAWNEGACEYFTADYTGTWEESGAEYLLSTADPDEEYMRCTQGDETLTCDLSNEDLRDKAWVFEPVP